MKNSWRNEVPQVLLCHEGLLLQFIFSPSLPHASKTCLDLGTVAHACNPSIGGVWGRITMWSLTWET